MTEQEGVVRITHEHVDCDFEGGRCFLCGRLALGITRPLEGASSALQEFADRWLESLPR